MDNWENNLFVDEEVNAKPFAFCDESVYGVEKFQPTSAFKNASSASPDQYFFELKNPQNCFAFEEQSNFNFEPFNFPKSQGNYLNQSGFDGSQFAQMPYEKKLFAQGPMHEDPQDESTSIKGDTKSERSPSSIDCKATDSNEGTVHASCETLSNAKLEDFSTEACIRFQNELKEQTPEKPKEVEPQQIVVEAPKTEEKVQPKVSKKPTTLRRDVVNKTVIRSVKRYYTQKYEETYKLNELLSEQQVLDRFVQLTFNTTFSSLQIFEDIGLNTEELVFFIRMLIQPDLVKKMNKTRPQRFVFNNYYDCIYKYSHKRLLKLSKNSTFIYLFEDFVKNGKFEQLVMEDTTLMRNPSAYLDAADNLMSLFSS